MYIEYDYRMYKIIMWKLCKGIMVLNICNMIGMMILYRDFGLIDEVCVCYFFVFKFFCL